MAEISLSCLCKLKTVTECINLFQSFQSEKRYEHATQLKLLFANARPSHVQCTSGFRALSYNKLVYSFLKSNKREHNSKTFPPTKLVSIALINCYLDILKESNIITKDLLLYLHSDLSEKDIFCFYHLISDKNIFTAQDFEFLLSHFKEQEIDIISLMSLRNAPICTVSRNSCDSFKKIGTLIGSNRKQTILYLYDDNLKNIVICNINKNKKNKDLRNKINRFIDVNFAARVTQKNKHEFMEFILNKESSTLSLELVYDDKRNILSIG